jgi:glycosyltransferase involved in cell wall biosynthesis
MPQASLMPAFDCTILIPLYNEQESLLPGIRNLLKFIAERGLKSEILLGNNGSTDATALMGKMLEEFAPGRIRFFHTMERGLVGEVFRTATQMARSPLLISVDIDLSIDLMFIPKALELLKENDIVVGSKQSGSQNRSFIRIFGSLLFIACARKMLTLPYDDYSIGAKGYRLEAVRPLVEGISEDTNYVLDLLLGARHANLRIAVLPVACEDWRKSRFKLLREALVRFSHLFRLWAAQFRKDY